MRPNKRKPAHRTFASGDGYTQSSWCTRALTCHQVRRCGARRFEEYSRTPPTKNVHCRHMQRVSTTADLYYSGQATNPTRIRAKSTRWISTLITEANSVHFYSTYDPKNSLAIIPKKLFLGKGSIGVRVAVLCYVLCGRSRASLQKQLDIKAAWYTRQQQRQDAVTATIAVPPHVWAILLHRQQHHPLTTAQTAYSSGNTIPRLQQK